MGSKKTNAKKLTQTTAKSAGKVSKPAKASSTSAKKSASSFTTDSSKAAYEHFVALARQVSTDGLEVCRADLGIARVNVDRGVTAITPHLATVKKKLPHCPIDEVLELPALLLAATFAAGKIAATVSTGEIDQRMAAMRPMREAALKQLEVFALLGIVPAGVPIAIRRGSGPLDAASDAIALPGAFHDHEAAIEGKHPFTPAMLKKLGEDGDWLAKHLKKTGAKAGRAERDPASVVRDQLWAIINERHEHLRQAGAVVFGLKSLDEHVPPLGARVAAASAGSEAKTNGQATSKAAPQPSADSGA
ncbi:Hypothetical protein A7982_07649 [Minicystis rosea]|nr:Hypothetical protein A7982_07649 [Minicystis rosea]